MPTVRAIVRDAAVRRLSVLVAGSGHREQHAVSDAYQGGSRHRESGSQDRRSLRAPSTSVAVVVAGRAQRPAVADKRGARDHVHHQDVVAPPDVPARHGRHAGAAAAGIDGAGPHRPGQRRRRTRSAGSAPSSCRSASGRDYWTPKTVGADFEFTPILKPLEPFRSHRPSSPSSATRSTVTRRPSPRG